MSIATKTVDLTDRQKNVLLGIAEGKKTEEIAKELDIKKVEVRAVVEKLFMKFGARNRKHLIEEAIRCNLLPKDTVPAS